MRRFNQSERLEQIFNYLREKRAVTIRDCVRDLRLERSTVSYYLNKLYTLGFVRKKWKVGSRSAYRVVFELRGDALDIGGISEINSLIQSMHNCGAEDECIKAD